MKNVIKLSFVAALLSIVSTPALADWATKVEDDIFTGGEKATLAGIEDDDSGIVFDCTKNDLKVNYIERSNASDLTEGIPVELLFKIDQNSPIKLNGQTEIRNSNFFGLSVGGSETSDDLKTLLDQIGNARHKILFGYRYPSDGHKASYTFGTSGSAVAVSKFVKACEIDMPQLRKPKN
jgi:hypothetical protein